MEIRLRLPHTFALASIEGMSPLRSLFLYSHFVHFYAFHVSVEFFLDWLGRKEAGRFHFFDIFLLSSRLNL